jgi:hypothetical protein
MPCVFHSTYSTVNGIFHFFMLRSGLTVTGLASDYCIYYCVSFIKVVFSFHNVTTTAGPIFFLSRNYSFLHKFLHPYLESYRLMVLIWCQAVYLSTYLSMVLQPFVGPWPLFSFLISTLSVGLLDGGSARRKASTYTQNKANKV